MEAYIERSPDAQLSNFEDALGGIYEEDVSAQTVYSNVTRWSALDAPSEDHVDDILHVNPTEAAATFHTYQVARQQLQW